MVFLRHLESFTPLRPPSSEILHHLSLFPFKDSNSQEKDEQANSKHIAVSHFGKSAEPNQDIAGILQDTAHGIEKFIKSKFLRDITHGIHHWCEPEPQLSHYFPEAQRIAHLHDNDAEDKAYSHDQKVEGNDQGDEPKHPKRPVDSIEESKGQKNDQVKEKANEGTGDSRHDQNNPGKIDLANHLIVADEAIHAGHGAGAQDLQKFALGEVHGLVIGCRRWVRWPRSSGWSSAPAPDQPLSPCR